MNINPDYYRVLPRDLFNEAKLLKCMGQLCLKIHDGMTPVMMTFRESGQPFKIALMEEGSLTITNLQIRINGKPFLFKTIYNSKANYPLYVEHENVDYMVFTDSGEFDNEFIEFCKTIK